MKISLLKNDKSTVKDEKTLALFILGCLVTGIALVIIGPQIWIITSGISRAFGVAWIMLAVMLAPVLLYRFMTNDKK